MSAQSRQVFPPELHALLARLQGGLCASCAQPVKRFFRSVDHVVPHVLGGEDKLGNYVMMDGDCNKKKADRMPNGCELIWLMAVNARLGVGPQTWKVAA